MFLNRVRSVHLVGVGGIGMSGLAELLLDRGVQVSGSDQSESATLRRLRGRGARVVVGHGLEHLQEADVVVRSTAVRDTNPELVEAVRRGLPLVHRAELLAELMRGQHAVAVAGTHGKTTTTAMLASCLDAGGLDPSVVVGGWAPVLGGRNARWGSGDLFVAEADESDGSFLHLRPTVTLVTNVDREHLDHYGTFEALEDAFVALIDRVPFYGFSVMCADHPVVQRLAGRCRRRVVSYGLLSGATFQATDVEHEGLESDFVLRRGGEALGRVHLRVPGAHNVSNATGALAAALELGVPFAAAAAALGEFRSVNRRFTVVGESEGVLVVDDYGHHPVEVAATLRAARRGFPQRRLVAVLQPHRYSRLADLWADFVVCAGEADQVVLVPVYAAGEPARPGVDHLALADAMELGGHRGVVAVSSLAEATDQLEQSARAGDVLITLGAGDVNRVAQDVLQRLQGRERLRCG